MSLLLLLCAPAYSNPPLSDSEFARLCALTTESVTEITRARDIAERAGYRLATYGGTSREIALFVRRKVAELGGASQFEAWLKGTERLHLLDWHHIQSDLDLLLIPVKGSKADEAEMAAVAKQIEKSLPGNIFFKETDVRVAPTFFREHPPGDEHFEAISNVAFGKEGMEAVDELTVDVNGKQRSLSEWGLSQLNSGELDFEINRQYQGKLDAYGSMRQLLRWLRYPSELPDFELSPAALKQMQDYFAWVQMTHGEQIRHLLQEGDQSFLGKSKPMNLGEKLIESLEKLQLYSPNPYKTKKLMDDLGLSVFLKKSGIASRRQLEPLPRLGVPPTPKNSGAGKSLHLRHRTSLAASQNIGSGAIWSSNYESVIGGKTTAAALGPGLYAAEGFQSVAYGDMYVEIVLHPNARPDIDYIKRGEFYVVRNRDAIISVQPLTIESLRKNFENQLADPEITRENKQSLLRGLASLYYPESHPAEWADFQKTLRQAEALGLAGDFIRSYLVRPGSLEYLSALAVDSEIRRSLSNYLDKNPAVAMDLVVQIRSRDRDSWENTKKLLQDRSQPLDAVMALLVGLSARSEKERRKDAVPYISHRTNFWSDDYVDYKAEEEERTRRFYKQRAASDSFWEEYLAAVKARGDQERHLSLLLVMPQRAWEAEVLPLLDPGNIQTWKAISETPRMKFSPALWEKLRNAWERADPELRFYLSRLAQRQSDWDKEMGPWSRRLVAEKKPGQGEGLLAGAAAQELAKKFYLTAAEIAEADRLLAVAGEHSAEVAKFLGAQAAGDKSSGWDLSKAYADNHGISHDEMWRTHNAVGKAKVTEDWTPGTHQTVLRWLTSGNPHLENLGLSVLRNRPQLSKEEWEALARIGLSLESKPPEYYGDQRREILSSIVRRNTPLPAEWTPQVWGLQEHILTDGAGFLGRIRDVKPEWNDSSWKMIVQWLQKQKQRKMLSSYELEIAWNLANERGETPPAELWKMVLDHKIWRLAAAQSELPREAWTAMLTQFSQATAELEKAEKQKKYLRGEEFLHLLNILLERSDAPAELAPLLEHPFIRRRVLNGRLGFDILTSTIKEKYEAARMRQTTRRLADIPELTSLAHSVSELPVLMDKTFKVPVQTLQQRCQGAFLTLGEKWRKFRSNGSR